MDRIIVETNDDMKRIINWCSDYAKNNGRPKPGDGVFYTLEEVEVPFERAEIVFKEENLIVDFVAHSDDPAVHMVMYIDTEDERKMGLYSANDREFAMKRGVLTGDKLKICTFDWNTETGTVTNQYTPYDNSQNEKDRERSFWLHKTLHMDNTAVKIGRKYNALILFASAYRPEIESRKTVRGESKTVSKKRNGKSKNVKKMLYVREYVISKDFTSNIPKRTVPRRKPDHEFDVRGFYRHYKSGKTVWIKPSTRCKGRGKKQDREYMAKVGT